MESFGGVSTDEHHYVSRLSRSTQCRTKPIAHPRPRASERNERTGYGKKNLGAGHLQATENLGPWERAKNDHGFFCSEPETGALYCTTKALLSLAIPQLVLHVCCSPRRGGWGGFIGLSSIVDLFWRKEIERKFLARLSVWSGGRIARLGYGTIPYITYGLQHVGFTGGMEAK